MHERDRQHADTHAFLEVADRAIGRIRTKARVKAAEDGTPLESPGTDDPGEGWGLTCEEELELTPAELRAVLRDDLGAAEASNTAKSRMFARQVKFRGVVGGVL